MEWIKGTVIRPTFPYVTLTNLSHQGRGYDKVAMGQDPGNCTFM